MEKKLKHLEMIQGVINRMGGNSFWLKGWCVTLVAAIVALATKNTSPWFMAVAYIPIPLFWALDTYYLRQERLFRALYDHVRVLKEESVDFSMKTDQFTSQVASFWGVLVSKTILPLYLGIAIVVTVALGVALKTKGG